MTRKKIKGMLITGATAVMLLLIVLFILFPFYWALNSSLKSEAQLQMVPATLVPRSPSTGRISLYFSNFQSVLTSGKFLRGIANSTIVSFFSVGLSLLSGAFAAFAISKLRFHGRRITLWIILGMTMFPQVTVLSGLYAVISRLQLNTYLSLILSYMLFVLPFTTWILTTFFKKIPDEILKSALVDGASRFQAFYKILLPLSAPALVTTALLSFIAAWNEYLFALTFTAIKPGTRTIPVVIALFSGTVSRQIPFGEIMAAAVIVTIPIVILVFIFQKRLVEGLTAGAVKG